MAGEGAALERWARRDFLKRGSQGLEDTSHEGVWVRDCLVEGMAGAKVLRWECAGWVPGAGVDGVARYG